MLNWSRTDAQVALRLISIAEVVVFPQQLLVFPSGRGRSPHEAMQELPSRRADHP